MPLNPNGKVDKPALPFPDTAQLSRATKSKALENGEISFSPLQASMRDIWLRVIPRAPSSIGLKDNFFDVGGHSILATRLIFEIRKAFAVNVPLGLVFRKPTIEELSREVEILQNGENGMIGRDDNETSIEIETDYANDAHDLFLTLPKSFKAVEPLVSRTSTTILLTGATGFLGAFILRDLLARENIKLVAHIRAPTKEAGLSRLRMSCEAYGVWKEVWAEKIEVVVGDLEKERLGLSKPEWDNLGERVDLILHNGAMVFDHLFVASLICRFTGSIHIPNFVLPMCWVLWQLLICARLGNLKL